MNYVPVGFPEINYEVETICCGERRTLFIEEDDVIDPNYM